MRPLPALLLLAALGVGVALWQRSAGDEPRARLAMSEPLSLGDIELSMLDGTSASVRGDGKALILNVWATWCAPCRRELPSLERLAQRIDPSAASVVGIAIDRDADFVREYLRDAKVTFPNFIDPAGTVTRAMLRVEGLPQTLIIAPDGRFLRRELGYREWDRVDIQAWLSEKR